MLLLYYLTGETSEFQYFGNTQHQLLNIHDVIELQHLLNYQFFCSFELICSSLETVKKHIFNLFKLGLFDG